jgi:malic enzyme
MKIKFKYLKITNKYFEKESLADVIKRVDFFIGASAPKYVIPEILKSMTKY